ncbi:NAD(P)-binding domain-containing protein [Plantibacter sp. Mn2098]|uniref:NAD(P)-binding domain-containing protein n=1 Tax=Plantibacter sp. Mn2098 TaxID=3395266 RepID=UPI003BD151FB
MRTATYEIGVKNLTKRVAIIGAGPSGMAQLRAFELAQADGRPIPDIVCFEKQADWGGQWNYSWRTGLDQHGEPVHSSMYRNLWSNGPKEALEFADYSFDEHFGRPISSYPPREVLWDYIDGRVQRSDVKKYVRFNTVVRWVEQDSETGMFTVTSEDLEAHRTIVETFDDIIVSTGHFSFPNLPDLAGLDTFPGRLCHAHDFRGAEALEGQDVLLVGSSYSAEDIGVQAHKMGARSVTISYRTAPMGYDWPAGIEEVPIVERFEGSTAHFVDGTSRRFDAVILCTGYLHKYPFLPDDLALDSRNCVYPANLYQGVVWQDNPHVFYLGAQDQWFTFNMFDAQAWFVRDVIDGTLQLPAADERQRDIDAWLERFNAIASPADEIRFQADYIRDLINATDYPMFDLDEVVEIFLAWKHDKQDDILGYRDRTYRSVITGTIAQTHHTSWLRELDDSLTRYLSTPDPEQDGVDQAPLASA